MSSKRIRIFQQLVEKAKSIDLNDFIKKNSTRLAAVFAASEKLVEFKDDFALVWDMLKAYAKREYTEIPMKSISAIVGAFLYILMPLDALPDFIIGFGLIDDAAVFGYALKLISDDIRLFAAWKEAKTVEAEVAANESCEVDSDLTLDKPSANEQSPELDSESNSDNSAN